MSQHHRRTVGYTYPWDVVGDEAFADRVLGLGLSRVALATAYHSVRAATPLHPRSRFVTARTAALYRPVRPEAWTGRRLTPAHADWVDGSDPAGAAASTLRVAGLDVAAWIVLTHASRLGQTHPDVAVTNCFGETYPYALCPQVEEVRDYARTLAAEAVRDLGCSAVVLEACGQLGSVHGGHHEKTEGAYDAQTQRLLSICCCAACRAAWRDRGLEPDRVVRTLRTSVVRLLRHPVESAESAEVQVDRGVEATVLEARRAATDALRRAVTAAVHDVAGPVEVVLHGDPDPWATGALPGLTPAAFEEADTVVAPCWPSTPASVEGLRRLVDASAGRAAAGAYVTVLPPMTADDLGPHLAALDEAGAHELHLYHLGLTGADRQPLLAAAAAAAPSPTPSPTPTPTPTPTARRTT